MKDVDYALSEISSIRAHLTANTCFRGISPGFNTVLAVLALVIATLQSILMPANGGETKAVVATWAIYVIASSIIIAVESVVRANRLHGSMAGMMLRTARQKTLPFLFAGTVISGVIWLFVPQALWLLPGLWMMMTGLMGFAVISSVPKGLAWVASWYFLCGTTVLVLAGYGGSLTPWMMGISYSVGQFATAIVVNRSDDGGSSACGKI